ncbi:hypothetical protein I656_00331 [Geobacillus sp. WSUCF1]|nr:hypothetical protein I656_00331 [Geobacillus sp. WSUCF1]
MRQKTRSGSPAWMRVLPVALPIDRFCRVKWLTFISNLLSGNIPIILMNEGKQSFIRKAEQL